MPSEKKSPMKSMNVNPTLILAGLTTVGLLASTGASAMDIMARVISSTPVVQQVAVPRQVCNNQQVFTQAPKTGGGALLGAVAGGAAGNAIGNGSGRAVATMLGLFGGAILGDRIEGPGGQQVQNVQQCSTQTFYENRPSYFNVVYEYQGTQYNTQMVTDPGQFVRLQVTPVGGMSSPPQPAFQNPQNQPSQIYQPPNQPQTYFQPAPMQPFQVQPPVSYGQSAYAPVVQRVDVYPAYPSYPTYPTYFQRPNYAPAVVPIGTSLNFGYSRSYGGHGGHWR
jgi:uncharacterized protein YcfJ